MPKTDKRGKKRKPIRRSSSVKASAKSRSRSSTAKKPARVNKSVSFWTDDRKVIRRDRQGRPVYGGPPPKGWMMMAFTGDQIEQWYRWLKGHPNTVIY